MTLYVGFGNVDAVGISGAGGPLFWFPSTDDVPSTVIVPSARTSPATVLDPDTVTAPVLEETSPPTLTFVAIVTASRASTDPATEHPFVSEMAPWGATTVPRTFPPKSQAIPPFV